MYGRVLLRGLRVLLYYDEAVLDPFVEFDTIQNFYLSLIKWISLFAQNAEGVAQEGYGES